MISGAWNRRELLGAAGAFGLLEANGVRAAADPPPETTRLRIVDSSALCFAPQYVVADLLAAEGFTQVEFAKRTPEVSSSVMLGSAEADISFTLTPNALIQIDAGQPFVLLAGGHVGCYEMFAPLRIKAVRDLKGKVMSISRRNGGDHVFAQMVMGNIGIDPNRDVQWRVDPWAAVPELLAQGKTDAYLGFPPEPQELRTKKIGHVIFNSRDDRPWSQYFCCMVGANREFARRNPVATKKALRAILKGMDLCATDPEGSARLAARHKPGARFEDVLQMVKDLRYGGWREFSAEDTVRFFALRLRDIGMVKSDPKKLLAQGTDWRFIEQLKRELKS